MKNNEIFKLNDNEYSLDYVPAELNFKEYSKLKAQVNSLSSEFSNWQVTTENIKESKEVRAKLRKLSKAWNDKKIAIVKVVDKPVKEFQDNIKELCTEVDSTASVIDEQIKAFEDKAKADKHEQHLKFIKKACEDAGADPDKIEYDSKWDNKSYSKTKFENEVDQQIAMIQQRQDRFAENAQVITQKADELGLPAKHWTDQLSSKSLPVILNEMQDYKDDLTAISAKQKETKVKEAQEMKQAGDTYIDPDTGEIKEKVITLKLEIKGNEWQMNQLKSFLQDNAIEYRGLEG